MASWNGDGGTAAMRAPNDIRRTSSWSACASACVLLILQSVGLAAADADAQIARIERLPRAQRPAAYESALEQRGLTTTDRQALARAFARQTKVVSPLYGKGKFPADVRSWAAKLREGF